MEATEYVSVIGFLSDRADRAYTIVIASSAYASLPSLALVPG